jgi:hypothetical protein
MAGESNAVSVFGSRKSMMVIGGSGISPGGDWVVVDDIASDLALGRCHFRLVYRSREMRRRWSVDVDVKGRIVERSVRPGKGSKRERKKCSRRDDGFARAIHRERPVRDRNSQPE